MTREFPGGARPTWDELLRHFGELEVVGKDGPIQYVVTDDDAACQLAEDYVSFLYFLVTEAYED